MALKTARVPETLAEVFEQAERTVARYFAARSDVPEHGTIEISGERYVLVRAASLSVECFRMVGDLFGPGRDDEAADFARNILFDLAHALGKSDAQRFAERMEVDEVAEVAACWAPFRTAGTWYLWRHLDAEPVEY